MNGAILAGLDLTDERVRSEYRGLIYESWISYNKWVKDPNYGDTDLAVLFEEFSPEEQQKDIDQLVVT